MAARKNRVVSPARVRAVRKRPKILTLPMSGTRLITWFERDRAQVSLVDAATEQHTIVEWMDDDVYEAVQDGFLDPRDWHKSAYDYAVDIGALRSPSSPRRDNPYDRTSLTGYNVYNRNGRLVWGPVDRAEDAYAKVREIGGGTITERWSVKGVIHEKPYGQW